MFQFKWKKAAYYLEEQRLQQYKLVGESLEQVTDRPWFNNALSATLFSF